MLGALRVGLTGLRINQRFLDVIGNNLTNAETIGFKSDRVTFSDIIYQTARQPTGPTGNVGGVNGLQTGFGAKIGSIDQNHTQGSLIATGRTFDLALQGDGFFVVSNGEQDLYSRVGTFVLDRDANLVDSRTGFKAQNIAGQDIIVNTDSAAAASATETVTLQGNLPAVVTGPLAEVQESAAAFEDHQPATLVSTGSADPVDVTNKTLTIAINGGQPVSLLFDATDTGGVPIPLTTVASLINSKLAALNVSPSVTASVQGGLLQLVSDTRGSAASIGTSGTAAVDLGVNNLNANGTESTAVATTRLNDLGSNTTPYSAGDTIQISGIDTAGQSVSFTFTYGPPPNDGETLGDLTTAVQNAFPGTTVTLVNGRINVAANATGESDLSIVIQDGTGSVGATSFGSHAFDTVVDGAGPDTRATSITIFDSLGIAHSLTGTFERQDDGTWNLDLAIPSSDGSVSGSPIKSITFGSDGTLQSTSSNIVDVTFNNGAAPQTIALDFGSFGSLSGLTQFGGPATVQATAQDGAPSGTLVSLGVTQGGVIQGFYNNGEVIDIDTIAVAQFQNNAGLVREGSTLFKRSDNSGIALINEPGVGGAATVISGALEGSNVDTAEEFVRLIEAQRAFQGAARVVTTADETFAELLQIV